MKYSKGWGAVLIILILLTADQALKIWIKTHMQLHESIEITKWFYLYFTENPGMAFGIEVIGKLVPFRIPDHCRWFYWLLSVSDW
jgi:signal peptidase II